MTRLYEESPVSYYDQCEIENPNDINGQLRCISDLSEQGQYDLVVGMDTFFLLFGSALMFFMQAGFAMLCAGSVRLKNVQNTMLKNLLDACGSALGFWSFGFALAYGKDDIRGMGSANSSVFVSDKITFIGSDNFFLQGYDNYSVWLFQFAFAATSATIVAGSLAERSQMAAYLCYSVLLTGFVYPVVVHSFWSIEGFLSPMNMKALLGTGVLDFAGAGVVHVTGGLTALIAVRILGPRKGRFTDERTGEVIANPRRVRGHSMSLQVLGVFILWFGWYGFNIGSTFSISSARSGKIASLAGVCTTLGGASGCVTSLLYSTYKNEKRTGETTFELVYALNGCLSGLVSITGGCAFVEPWAAVVIGGCAGFIYCFASAWLVRLHIDDAVDAIPVHLFNGIWGVVCVGLFANPDRLMDVYDGQYPYDKAGLFYQWSEAGNSDGTLLASQLIGVLFILGWVFIIMTPFFLLLSYIGWLRSDPLEEIVGLDISYHGRSAYNTEIWDATADMTGQASEKGLYLDDDYAKGEHLVNHHNRPNYDMSNNGTALVSNGASASAYNDLFMEEHQVMDIENSGEVVYNDDYNGEDGYYDNDKQADEQQGEPIDQDSKANLQQNRQVKRMSDSDILTHVWN